MVIGISLTAKKIVEKVKFEIFKRYEYFIYRLGKHNSNLVVFEGGIGAQLFAYFEFLYLVKKGEEVEVNLQYFNESTVISTELKTPENRAWGLDRYGITLDNLKSQSYKVSRRYNKIPTNLLGLDNLNYFTKYLALDLKNQFSIDESWCNNFYREYGIKKENRKKEGGFYAIHIRRGDFLKVASKILSEDSILQLSLKLFSKLPKLPILIFSDSAIDLIWIKEFKNLGFKQILLMDHTVCSDLHSHDLLRSAKVLVASNSFFSLSAAILSTGEQLAFIPMKFYSGYRDTAINKLINELCEFSVFYK